MNLIEFCQYLEVPCFGFCQDVRRKAREAAHIWAGPGNAHFLHLERRGAYVMAIFERTIH